jgi:glycosyltransferase involved in cell wall biosynthesis
MGNLNKSILKIAIVAPFGLLTKGTVSARILPLALALAARGHQVRLIVPPWDDPPTSHAFSAKQATLEKVEGVEILTLPLFPKPLVVSLPLRMVWATKSFRPDIIHVFKPKAYSGLAAFLLACLGTPFVLDTDDWEGAGGYNEVNPYSTAQKLLFAWQEQDLPQRAKAITVASHTLQSLVWSMGIPPHRVIYLPNGISKTKYAEWLEPNLALKSVAKRIEMGLDDKIVLLAYTRFVEFKPVRLLEIFQCILEKLPAAKAAQTRLVVVGSGFYNEHQDFQKLVLEKGLATQVLMVGQVTWDKLPEMLGVADIALYPFDDNLINRARCSAKLLELLIVARAVVTEAVGENSSYIEPNVGGKLIKPYDKDAFAQAVVDLIVGEPQLRQEMGKQAASRLWQEYAWSQLVEPLEHLYFQFALIA